MRRIRGGFLSGGNHLVPANVHGVLAPKLPRDFLQRFLHAFAVFGPRKIDERLVHKLRNLRFRFCSRHILSPSGCLSSDSTARLAKLTRRVRGWREKLAATKGRGNTPTLLGIWMDVKRKGLRGKGFIPLADRGKRI